MRFSFFIRCHFSDEINKAVHFNFEESLNKKARSNKMTLICLTGETLEVYLQRRHRPRWQTETSTMKKKYLYLRRDYRSSSTEQHFLFFVEVIKLKVFLLSRVALNQKACQVFKTFASLFSPYQDRLDAVRKLILPEVGATLGPDPPLAHRAGRRGRGEGERLTRTNVPRASDCCFCSLLLFGKS